MPRLSAIQWKLNISKLNVEENGFGKPQVTVGYDNAV
jgi:hypothetical protein